jgi:hypothetical protein
MIKKLTNLLRPRAFRRVHRHRREERHGAVPPRVQHVITRVGRQLELHLVEMENREELHGVVSRILDVRHLLRDA